MKSAPIERILDEVIAGLFILLFVYTGYNKLQEHQSFEKVMARFPVVGSMSTFFAYALPIVELLTAVLLIAPSKRKIGFYFSLALMICFTCYIASMLLFSEKLPCSCGGVLKGLTWLQHFIFNLCFTVLAVAGIYVNKRRKMLLQ